MRPLSDHPYRLYASIVTATQGPRRQYTIIPLPFTSDVDAYGEVARGLFLRLSYEAMPPGEGWENHEVYTTTDLTDYVDTFLTARDARRHNP